MTHPAPAIDPVVLPYIPNKQKRYFPHEGVIYLSKYLDVQQRTVVRWVKKGILPGYIKGGKLCLPMQDFADYINGQWAPAPDPSPMQTITSLIKHRDTRASA